MSISPGVTYSPETSTTRSAPPVSRPAATAAICLSLMPTSAGPSIPFAGSITCPPFRRRSKRFVVWVVTRAMLPCRRDKETEMTTAVVANAARLPHWDMSRIFPGLESDAFDAAFTSIISDIAELRALYDRHDVRKRETSEPLSDQTVGAVEEIIG